MSFIMNLFGKSKQGKEEISAKKTAGGGPARKSIGTVLRQPDGTTPITKEKEHAEPTVLEIAEQQNWEDKTLPVWKPGDVILDTYEVEDVISGGMGHVYIANHKNWNVKLAIKSPNEMMLSDRSNFARILREANSWTELGLHPNIAYCYYVRNIEEVPHIFVEYVDGGNLRQWIEEGKCIDYRTSLDLAIQFCHGMENAHSKGMIHRDIKPENVLMTQDGILKITDFGLVRGGDSLQAEDPSIQSDSQAKSSSLTVVGAEMGTWGYMSPEQKENPHEVDERTDIFAFGVCLYEMFCGNKPYEITFGPRQEPPDPVSLSSDEGFPIEIGAVLTKAAQWEPTERHKDFSEIRQTLLNIFRDLFEEESPYAELELLDLEADGYNNQGVSYFDLGREEDAIASWEKALEINKLHPEATYNLSLILWRAGKIADDEVLRRLDNCRNNPALDRQMLAELKAFIHAERLDLDAARDVLKSIPGRYKVLFSGKDVDQIESIHTLEGHKADVTSLALTPDSRHVVSASKDKLLCLWELESGRCVQTMSGHTRMITSVALTPDGRFAVSCSDDMTLRVWELKSGRCIFTLRGHEHDVTSLAITLDGRYAVSGSKDTTLRVWDLATGRCKRTLKGHTETIESVALTHDGRYVVSGSYDKTVRVWKRASGRCKRTLRGHSYPVFSVVLTPDSRYVMSGSMDTNLRMWDLESGERLPKLGRGHADSVKAITLFSGGRYALSYGDDYSPRVWELESGRCICTLSGHEHSVTAAALTPDSRYAVSGSKDKTLRVWKVATGKCIRTLQAHTEEITSVALTPDGRYAVSGSSDKTLRIWKIMFDKVYQAELSITLPKGFIEIKQEEDALDSAIKQAKALFSQGDYSNSFAILFEAWRDTGFSDRSSIKQLYSGLMEKGRIKGLSFSFQKEILKGHTHGVNSVALTPDNRYAISASLLGITRIWDLATNQFIRTLKGNTPHVHSVILTADSRFAAVGSDRKTVLVWEIETGKLISKLVGHERGVTSVTVTPDGRYAVSSSKDKTLRVWELASGECIRILVGHTHQVGTVVVTPDGLDAVSGSGDGTLRVWELESGECICPLKGHTRYVNSVAVTPDGRYVVSGSGDGTLRVWELESGECIGLLKGHVGYVSSVAVTPDGRYAVSGSEDKSLRVWELVSGECIGNLKGHTKLVTAVNLTTDGRYVISGSFDNTLRIWEFIWDLDFPHSVDWDESVRTYLEIFFILNKAKWTEKEFQKLIKELAEKRGYGWVRPDGIRRELEKMTQNWRS